MPTPSSFAEPCFPHSGADGGDCLSPVSSFLHPPILSLTLPGSAPSSGVRQTFLLRIIPNKQLITHVIN